VLWGVVKLQPTQNVPRLFGLKRLIESGRLVGIQIVHDNANFVSIRIMGIGELFHTFSEIDFGALLAYINVARTKARIELHSFWTRRHIKT